MFEFDMQTLYNRADEAGKAAVAKAQIVPMFVGNAVGLSDKLDETKPVYYVEDGVCGFAWVNVKPGNSAFAKWLKAQGIARTDDYYKGVSIWIRGYGQSMQKKEAYAQAMAKVFSDAGITAYAMSRMD